MTLVLYFKHNLRYLRKKMGVNQSFIAQKIGKTQKTIANWENGTSEPSLAEIIWLSHFFSIPLNDLLVKNLSENLHKETVSFPIPGSSLTPELSIKDLLQSKEEIIQVLRDLVAAQRHEIKMLSSSNS